MPEGVENIEIKRAGPSDTEFIEALSGRVFNRYGPYRETIVNWVQSGLAITLKAVINGKPAGFAMFGLMNSESGQGRNSELLAIAVEPERQGLGIGKRLMGASEEIAAKFNAGKMVLNTATDNIWARNLFLKQGFKEGAVIKGFYPAGQDAITMQKGL